MNLIKTERVKLTATYLNNIAVAIFVVGGLAPVISVVTTGNETPGTAARVTILLAVCVAASAALHIAAVHFLRELEP